MACWIPGAPSEQARNRPPLGQRVVFPSTSGLRKLPACLSQRCQRGGGALSDWGAASAGVPCVPRHRPPALRRENESSPHIHPGDPTFTLVLSPAGKTLSPAPSEEDRVPREMSRSALLQDAKRTMCQRRGWVVKAGWHLRVKARATRNRKPTNKAKTKPLLFLSSFRKLSKIIGELL